MITKTYALFAAMWIITIFPGNSKAFECVSYYPSNGTVSIVENTPVSGKILDRGSTVNFSGVISYNNAVSGSYVYVGLMPFPADTDNISRLITINIIRNMEKSSGTVNYNGDVRIERDIADTISLLNNFKVRAILFHPDFTCSEIVHDTQAHPVLAMPSLDMIITILRIMSGSNPTEDAIKNIGDVNGDGKIGMEEAVYVMQRIAGLR